MTIRAVAPPCALKLLLSFFAVIMLGTLCPQATVAQSPVPSAFAPSPLLPQLLQAIQSEEQRHAPPEKLGYLWAALATRYHTQGDFQQSLAAHEHALHLLTKASADYATELDNLGALYLEYGLMVEAEASRKKAWTVRKQIGDPIAVARSEQHLAEIHLALHRFREAEKGALAAYRTLADVPDPLAAETVGTMLSALVTATFAQCSQPKCAEGLRHAEQAMQIVRKVYPADSVELAHVSMALGFAQWKTGSTVDAEENMQTGIRLMRARLGEHNPMLLAATYEYRNFLAAMHRPAELAALDLQLGTMTQPQAAPACATCTISVYGLRSK